MSIIKIRAFTLHEGEFTDHGTTEIDTDDGDQVKHLRDLHKHPSATAIPVNDDGTIDLDGMKVLLTAQKRRGSWTAEMVEMAHQVWLESDVSYHKIVFQIYEEHGVEVSPDRVGRIIKQRDYTDIKIRDGLREAVIEKLAQSNGDMRSRSGRGYSDQLKDMVIQSMLNGESGRSCSKRFNVGISTCNKWFREYKASL